MSFKTVSKAARSAAPQRALHRKHFSSSIDSTTVLTREFIHAALYAKEEGYFTTQQREVLHAPTQGIDFGNLWGAREYRNVVAKLYMDSAEAWLTPVEIFAPFYSHAVARYMLNSPFFRQPLNIYEIGGGSGSNALHILNFLKEQVPTVYANTKYTLIEISSVMAERQRKRVAAVHPQQCTIVNEDILNFAEAHAPITSECFFLAFEVLDNLPHDKVSLQNGQWFETVVRNQSGANGPMLEEARRPIEDMLIRETLLHFGCDLPLRVSYKNNTGLARHVRRLLGIQDVAFTSAFIPTGAMQLLKTLRIAFPKHHLIAADFDSLPAPELDTKSSIKAISHPLSPTATSAGTLSAGNAPLVASKITGVTQDHDTYLVQGGVADIFFPTDFSKLKKAYCFALQREPDEISVVKSSTFLKEFADVEKTKTITRFNPLLEDYSNTSFILS
ncbi:Putative S-adenosyl-L-methionine-dependent methyltransferase MidA [Plasmopara halstedii]|uniref:Protein arginine methyltransferase NDUFAF7 n=1 Tax=Plasmopara halstedii TaxID=4781 RepID=A0A0N7L747_PLAHL|nr:Putative S-adenosyl-L-methionine-dependent methyltransferase MidA [Plasmopara halstedii]CEG46067.1 Putative S-adenosyl-L-methionine-dependent methyltransferase MidA [Plasmopara halstedii]|eukprot:XP_024582436.1 Putative S-adenosyl-L-methionine-dependent methyltransferase MidA [Plasmopara halstedii]